MKFKSKYLIITALFMIIGFFSKAHSQDTTLSKLPSYSLKDTHGKMVNVADLDNDSNPILIVFWKTCCKPHVNMLDAIAEVYQDWVDETGVVLYAISIDDSRSTNRVSPFVSGRGWDFEVLLDPNSDFKRAMNIILTPHTFLLNGNGEIVWQKALFMAGDEEEIFNQIQKLKN